MTPATRELRLCRVVPSGDAATRDQPEAQVAAGPSPEALTTVPAARWLAVIARLDAALFVRSWGEHGLLEELARPFAWIALALQPEAAASGRHPLDGWDADPSAARLLGYCVMWLLPPEAELLRVAVSPAARRGGVARTLLAAGEAAARARGCDSVALEVGASNTAARGLYASVGYTQVGLRRGYYTDPPDDALNLRRDLTQPPRG